LEEITSEARRQSCALFKETGVLCPIHEGKLDRNQVTTSLTSVLKRTADDKVEVTHEAMHDKKENQDLCTQAKDVSVVCDVDRHHAGGQAAASASHTTTQVRRSSEQQVTSSNQGTAHFTSVS